MKVTSTLYLLLILTGIAISSCKKHATNIPIGMTCKINNDAWVATTYSARIIPYAPGPMISQPMLGIIGYTGSWDTADVIGLTIDNYTSTPATYTVSDTGRLVINYIHKATGENHIAKSGTVTLMKVSSNNIQGTFSFVADNFSVTNGQFNINIQ